MVHQINEIREYSFVKIDYSDLVLDTLKCQEKNALTLDVRRFLKVILKNVKHMEAESGVLSQDVIKVHDTKQRNAKHMEADLDAYSLDVRRVHLIRLVSVSYMEVVHVVFILIVILVL